MSRLDFFLSPDMVDQNRMWWFKRNKYLPQIIANLTEEQWLILKEWYIESGIRGWAGECNIPIMSTLLGLIDGNDLDRIVQLGHFAGWSTLFMGWALQRMGRTKALYTLDTNPTVTKFTFEWVKRAGLQDVVEVVLGDSKDPIFVKQVRVHFMDRPKMIFIDSSHQYDQTIEELNLWYPFLAPGGIVVLHDVGTFAQQYDKTGKGGVHDAMQLWVMAQNTENIMINKVQIEPLIMQDACGLGIIQKLS